MRDNTHRNLYPPFARAVMQVAFDQHFWLRGKRLPGLNPKPLTPLRPYLLLISKYHRKVYPCHLWTIQYANATATAFIGGLPYPGARTQLLA